MIRLDHICFDKYAVAGIEHDALVKSTTKIFFKFCGLLRKPELYATIHKGRVDALKIFCKRKYLRYYRLDVARLMGSRIIFTQKIPVILYFCLVITNQRA